MDQEAVTVEAEPLGPPNPMNLPSVLPLANGETGIVPYQGASTQPVSPEAQAVLIAPLHDADVEIRPDGLVYLPEIKYRRKLIQAFGSGGWALIPRSGYGLQDQTLTREYALFAGGRFLAEARGEQDYIPNNPQMSYSTAAEGVKSNALMRCCKDLGIASELWDPAFIEPWKGRCALQVWRKGKNKPEWRRTDREPFYDETGPVHPHKPMAPKTSSQKPSPADGAGSWAPGMADVPTVPPARLGRTTTKPRPTDDAAKEGRPPRPTEPANAPPGPLPAILPPDQWKLLCFEWQDLKADHFLVVKEQLGVGEAIPLTGKAQQEFHQAMLKE